jgi:sugar O-acyltransferase (sialic acid O-acetyltransferase NeuD family)
VIVGTGDHARVMADVARAIGREPIGFVEPTDDGSAGGEVDGLPVLGSLASPDAWRVPLGDETVEFVVAIGANATRERAFARSLELGLRAVALVHPTAVLLGGAEVLPGGQVCAGTVIGLAATIGRDAIVNTAASVDHDGRIGDHAFVGPGARLAGRVTVEIGAHIGLGAVVREGCTIGARSYVAAGAVVVRDVLAGIRVAGVPARPMDRPSRPEEDV